MGAYRRRGDKEGDARRMENLRGYQIADLSLMMKLPRCVNASEPGTGKTASSCVYSYYRIKDDNSRFVWVQPSSLLQKNLSEMARFTPLTHDELVIIKGTPKQKLAQIESGARGFFMTAEALASYGPRLKELYTINLVVIDESHMLYKGHESKRTQALYQFMRTTPYLVFMSGTIIQGNLNAFYPVAHLLEPRLYGNFAAFRAYHEWTDDYGSLLGWRNTEKIAKIMSLFGWKRTFAETYGDQEKVIIVEEVEMNPRQKKAYLTFEKDALLELEDSYLDGSIPGVNQIRARQILAHPHEISNPLGGIESVVGDEPTAKDERLEILATDHLRNGTPFVVFAVFTREVERIHRLLSGLGLQGGVIHGQKSFTERGRVDEAFRAGRIQYIVATPPTAGIGFNWQEWGPDGKEVDHIIFCSVTYNDDEFVQAYMRAVRGARKKSLRITILKYIAKVEDRIFELVRKKSATVNAIDPTRELISIH